MNGLVALCTLWLFFPGPGPGQSVDLGLVQAVSQAPSTSTPPTSPTSPTSPSGSASDSAKAEAEAVAPIVKTEPEIGYEPSPAYPYGRPHPDAPGELAQFAFFIGEFDCIDRIRRPDGTWVGFKAIWNASYFLNGFGIQDRYWNSRFSTSNIRIFDPVEETWKITFFRMPGYASGVWEGGLERTEEGEILVFRSVGTTTGPGLTFFDIGDDGFKWRDGEPASWTSSCTRRRP